MNKQTEALKMAIEALENSLTRFSTFNELQHEAIQACKEALEQPAPEPVAWKLCKDGITAYLQSETPIQEQMDKYHIVPLYTHPALSWQRLSDDERQKIARETGMIYFTAWDLFARAIESKLEEKNT